MQRWSLLVLLFACATGSAQEAWRPGLLATWRDDKNLQIVTVESALAFSLKPGEAPHPRLTDSGAVRWEGLVKIDQAGAYLFAALLRGKVRLLFAGKEVLAAEALTRQRFVGPIL